MALLWLNCGCDKGGDSDSGAGTGAAGDQPAGSAADSGSINGNTPASDGKIIEQLALDSTAITLQGELPADWPSELQLFPDATLGETMMTEQPHGNAFSAKLKTTAAPLEVLRFYEQQTTSLGGDVTESTIGPERCFGTYLCPNYTMNLTAELAADGTDIMIAVNPPTPDDGQRPAIIQLVDQDAVPDGFPEDMIPRYPGSRIINSYLNGLGFYSIEMLTTDSLEAAADYYRKHFAELGWEESSPVEKDIVRAYSFSGKGKLLLNVSSGGDSENHISISYDENE